MSCSGDQFHLSDNGEEWEDQWEDGEKEEEKIGDGLINAMISISQILKTMLRLIQSQYLRWRYTSLLLLVL